LSGCALYVITASACALSTNIYFLIAVRILQAVGAGGITAVGLAMVKDCYSGGRREKILAVVQTASGLAPIFGPVVGAFILQYVNWRGTFWFLAIMGIIILVFALLCQETLREADRYLGNLSGAMKRLLHVAKNKSFIIPNIIFALGSLAFMGYIALSSYIYVEHFGLSEQMYSYFFAITAFTSLFGPMIYVKCFMKTNKVLLVAACFGFSIAGGILMVTVGGTTPYLFIVSISIFYIAGAIPRPFNANLLLEQQKGDTGSASSIINTSWTIMGAAGMSIASLPWGNIVVTLGVMIITVSTISIVMWFTFLRSKIPCIGLK